MLQIGVGKADITAFYKNAAMLGYAMFHHVMEDIETPLYARAFLFKNNETNIGFVNCELGFITPALKNGVLKKLNEEYSELGLTAENLLICAQHTHCAPGGYSYYSLYNTAIPGFIVEVFEKIVNGIVDSIVLASKNMVEGNVYLSQGKFEPETTISFNRSLKAYNRNKDVEPLPFSKRHLAANRNMTLLNIVDSQGNELGSINWFAVHTTSLSNNFYKVCSDNKGYASKYLERAKSNASKDYVGVFAQGNCGDISPKWVHNPKLPFTRGKYEGQYPDDLKSAKYSGHLQYQKAEKIINEIPKTSEAIGSRLDSAILYVDFGAIDIDNKFADGQNDCVTSPSCMGISMLEGSHHDGPGMHPIIGSAAKILSKWYKLNQKLFVRDPEKIAAYKRKYKAQGVKNIALESVTHRVFMAKHARRFFLPSFIDETIGNIKHFDTQGAYETRPWTPQVLPLQIVRLGNIAICGLPFEITTVAGYRLQKTLEDALIGQDGYEHVILAPYSNAYSGYVTTTEEYQEQMYEAGHCVFGQWTLNAVQQEFHGLAKQMLASKENRNANEAILPPDFTQEELNKIKHFESAYAKKQKRKAAKRTKRLKRHEEKMNKHIGV